MLELNDKELADVAFEVGTEECKKEIDKRSKLTPTLFHAHLFPIKKGAPILYELCKAGGNVRINHVKANVFGGLLRYLYGEELGEDISRENAREFINTADKYGAVHLKMRAEAEYV